MIGKIREPREEDFLEEEQEMAGDLGDLPSLLSKKKSKTIKSSAKGAPSQTKRAPIMAEADTAELKKQKTLPGSGSGKAAQKDKSISEKVSVEIDVPKPKNFEDTLAETSSPVPFIFAPQIKEGKPVLLTDSVRTNPRLGLPVLQGVCLPEDMKQIPSDFESNIVDMFSHLTLVSNQFRDLLSFCCM